MTEPDDPGIVCAACGKPFGTRPQAQGMLTNHYMKHINRSPQSRGMKRGLPIMETTP